MGIARSVTLARRCFQEAPLWLQAVLPACLMLGLITSGVGSHVVDNLPEILNHWQRLSTEFLFDRRGSWHAPWQHTSFQQCNIYSSRLLEIDVADLSLIAQAVMFLGPICGVNPAIKPCILGAHLAGAIACHQSRHPPPPTPHCRLSTLCRHVHAYPRIHTPSVTYSYPGPGGPCCAT